MKTLSADGSVGSPHVRVGHRQALNIKAAAQSAAAFLLRPFKLARMDLRRRLAVDFFHRGFERFPVADPCALRRGIQAENRRTQCFEEWSGPIVADRID